MTKALTFSRTFPAYHPKAGTLTFFPEKISGSLILQNSLYMAKAEPHIQLVDKWFDSPKHHTIRAGKRWKVGDWFKPVVWGTDINPKSGRSGPYHSKQITIAPDIEVKKVWDIKITHHEGTLLIYINDVVFAEHNFGYADNYNDAGLTKLATNDGLDFNDFIFWFILSPAFKKSREFEGQIICWNDNITYAL